MAYAYNLVEEYMDATSGSISEPITVQNVKDWIRLEGFTAEGGSELAFTDDDTILSSIIKSVRQWFEETTWLTLTSDRTRKAVITNLCGGQLLPFGPVKAITAAVDRDGETISLTDTLKTDGIQFLSIREPLQEKMVITYTAGYGSLACEALPETIKHELIRAAGWYYMNRDDMAAAQAYTMKLAAPFSKKPVIV